MSLDDDLDPFTRSRMRKTILVSALLFVNVLVWLLATIFLGGKGLLISFSLDYVLMVLLGIYNAISVKSIAGILYPFGTCIMILTFAWYFLLTIVLGLKDMGDGKLLQIY